jgi:hypothetical protein
VSRYRVPRHRAVDQRQCSGIPNPASAATIRYRIPRYRPYRRLAARKSSR